MECKLPSKCWCSSCRKSYDAKRFQSIKSERYAQVKARRHELVAWVRSLKEGACVDCAGKFHPAAMQFDHISDNKVTSVADLVKSGYSRQVIQQEIDKCELVCANCHAVRTHTRRVV
jgi:hypothetical protein